MNQVKDLEWDLADRQLRNKTHVRVLCQVACSLCGLVWGKVEARMRDLVSNSLRDISK